MRRGEVLFDFAYDFFRVSTLDALSVFGRDLRIPDRLTATCAALRYDCRELGGGSDMRRRLREVRDAFLLERVPGETKATAQVHVMRVIQDGVWRGILRVRGSRRVRNEATFAVWEAKKGVARAGKRRPPPIPRKVAKHAANCLKVVVRSGHGPVEDEHQDVPRAPPFRKKEQAVENLQKAEACWPQGA
jgi:hypothetical protein